ncbi:MAG: ABC transporter permease [Bacteroidia bacterium]|nr:ABC transporter permease [Bacteroidia bacterium]
MAKKRFLKNKLAVVGLIFLGICTLVGIFGYAISPDSTQGGNFQILELAKHPPGTRVHLLLRPKAIPPQESRNIFAFLASGKPDLYDPVPFIPFSKEELVRFRGDTLIYQTWAGLTSTALLPDFALNPDKTADQTLAWQSTEKKPYHLEKGKISYIGLGQGPLETDLETLKKDFLKHQVDTRTFWLGTDGYGRDVLSRLILGTRVSLSVGLLAVLISLFVGISLGAMAGFFRGWLDQVIMWFVSVVWSIPTLLLAISITFAFEKGFWQVFVAIGLSMWVEVARIVRGQIFSIREMQYIEATKSLGFGAFRTITRHILPNIMSPVIIVAAANFASAILIEAGLSFLGVGVQPPVPSWGTMIREGYTYIIFESGKWLAIFPGLAIVLVVISLNLVGFGLRDALDPKMK